MLHCPHCSLDLNNQLRQRQQLAVDMSDLSKPERASVLYIMSTPQSSSVQTFFVYLEQVILLCNS